MEVTDPKLKLDSEEIKKMPFDAFHEFNRSSFSKNLTIKIKLKKYFTAEELEEFPRLLKVAERIYNNPPRETELTIQDYHRWLKIGKFLHSNWCIHK